MSIARELRLSVLQHDLMLDGKYPKCETAPILIKLGIQVHTNISLLQETDTVYTSEVCNIRGNNVRKA